MNFTIYPKLNSYIKPWNFKTQNWLKQNMYNTCANRAHWQMGQTINCVSGWLISNPITSHFTFINHVSLVNLNTYKLQYKSEIKSYYN